MSPPLLPDFPLLTTTGSRPSSLLPPPVPSPYPRDPNTGTTIWYPISNQPAAAAWGGDHIRQRLKLVRHQIAVYLPLAISESDENDRARQEVRYAALHAARESAKARSRAEVIKKFGSGNPFEAWGTVAVLPEDVFYRPPVPASVASLTGVPSTAWGYGRVCMAHPVRVDLTKNDGNGNGKGKGVGIPVFAGEVGERAGGMTPLEKFDPVARRDRTERFDVVRFEKAVWEAKTMGGRDRKGRCLRCRVRDLPCSLERKRGAEKKECEGCRRNGCVYCLRIVCDRETARVARRFSWVKVSMVKGRRKGEIVVWVRDEEEGKVDADEVRKCAEELLEVEGTRIWGMTLDANDTDELVLPSWQEVYFAVAKSEAEKDKAFVDSYLGYETDLRVVHTEDLTWKDWFQLQEQRRRARRPYTSREDYHVRPYRRKLAAPPVGKHTDT